MREILFRGKWLDNGDWVEGAFLNDRDGAFYICPAVSDISYGDSGNRRRIGCWYKVDPSTVGQYTGLNDKNGERIFEGDMIKPFDDEIDKMVVEFHYGQFLLCLYGERGYLAEYGWEEEGNYGCFESEPLSSYGDDIEIIGNIHDNPEFMKGDDDDG